MISHQPATADLLSRAVRAVAAARCSRAALSAVLSTARAWTRAAGASLLWNEQEYLIPVASDGVPTESNFPDGDAIPAGSLRFPLVTRGRLEGFLLLASVAHPPVAESEDFAALLDLAALALRDSRVEDEREHTARSQTTPEAIRLLAASQAQRAQLEASEQRLREVYQTAASGLVVYDRTGRINQANQAAEAILGFPLDRILGASIGELPWKSADLDLADMGSWSRSFEVLREGRPVRDSLMPILRGGTVERWLRGDAIPILGPDGQVDRVIASFIDVTDQVRAERALQAHVDFLQQLIDSIPNPVFYQDTDRVYRGCNAAFLRYLGRSHQEVVGKSSFEVLSPEQAGRYQEADAELLNGGGVQVYETEIRSATGELRNVIFNKARFANLDGSPGGIVGVILDISERKQLEQERLDLLLREQAARLEAETMASLIAAVAGNLDPAATLQTAVERLPALFGASICGVLLPEPDGRLTYRASAGAGAETMQAYTFYPGQGLVGRAFSEGKLQRSDDLVLEPSSHRPDLDLLTRTRAFLAAPLIAHGETLGVIVAEATEPGAYTDHHAALLTTISHHVATALATAQLWEATQREADTRAAILEQMAEGVLVVDTTARVILANPVAAAVFGLPLESMGGLDLVDVPGELLHDDGTPVAVEQRPLRRALAGQRSTANYRIRTADRRDLRTLSTAAPLRDRAGEVRGAILVIRDMTEEHQRQQQAAEGQKLRALGQIASGVAHDLNQNLGLIAGHGELALRALREPSLDFAAMEDSLNTVVQAAMDGAGTVRRLLAFARPTSEGPAELIDLGELLGEVARLTAPQWRDAAQAERRPILLDTLVDGATRIEGWRGSLREALTNLILNAVDALPRGGSIHLVARGSGDRVTVEVTDTGIGMSADLQARVFEPFFTTKGDRGTGLGLAMVLGIVEHHGGSIALESAPGGGTTFRLTFRASNLVSVRDIPVAETGSTAPLRVLAVDDEPALGRMLAQLLQVDGHRVVVATSGEQALEMLATEPFDLVVSDVGMGAGMNGWELAEQTLALDPTICFALATGWGAMIDPEDARARGIAAVLAKPYRLADLQRLLGTVKPR